MIDINGDSIWFTHEWEKDAEGNYVKNKLGGYNLIGITMHVSGKVINVSNDYKDIDIDQAVSEITEQIESSFQGTVHGIEFKTNVNLTGAESMNDVGNTDHVFALADFNKWSDEGAVNDFGHKVAFVDAAYFSGVWDEKVGNKGKVTAAHEFGHLASLRHEGVTNLMTRSSNNFHFSFATQVTNKQLEKIYGSRNYLNRGLNYEYVHTKDEITLIKMPRRGRAKKRVKY